MSDKTDKQRVDLALHLAAVSHANDSRPVFERLRDYVARGVDSPESLSLSEIRQICFALSVYLSQQR